MKSVEVTTTQNVTIHYELANTGQRILAFMLDLIFIILLVFTFSMILKDFRNDVLMQLGVWIPVLFYSPVSEMIGRGQSLGKKLTGIRVLKADGGQMHFTDYALRWAFRWADIYFSLGSLATLLVSSTEKCQRIGDLFANTTVVRLEESHIITVNDLLNIKSSSNYEVKYPEIKKLTEADLLFVKHVLYQSGKVNNFAHQLALENTAIKMATILNVPATPKPYDLFLRQLISDYIVLTR